MKTKETLALSTTARSAIAAAFADALNTNETTGSLVTQVCDVAIKYTKGEDIAESDRSAIASMIAKARGWGRNVLKQRVSEVNVILKAHATLPEATSAFKKRSQTCQWHSVMKLARQINQGKTIAQAVTFALKKTTGPKGTPEGRLAGALASIVDELTGAKRKAVIAAARMLVDERVLKFTGKNAEKFTNA